MYHSSYQRLRITSSGKYLDSRSVNSEKPSVPQTLSGNKGSEDEAEARPKEELRRKIKRWWEGIADHVDKIVSFSAPKWRIS